jgi:glyoxylase-like metal-dependent hydrolase (beta-lactamase superfamily II)
VDPGFDRVGEEEKALKVLKEAELEVRLVIDTHGHPDHIAGNAVMKRVTGAPVLIHKLDADKLTRIGMKADGFLEEGDAVRFGDVTLKVLHTPGHSPGSISLLGKECVFTGDTLFSGSIGRVDLPGGSGKDIMHSLLQRLAKLPDELVVYPGHGPETTVRREKQSNPFLQRGFDPSLLL